MGLALAVQPGKGYSVTYARPPAGPRLPLLLGEVRVAVTPMGDTLRFGGTMELAGLDLSVNRRRVAAIVRGAARYLHDVDRFRVQEIWRGLRPVTPDGLPLLGRSSRVENLVVATGHAMVGMLAGPHHREAGRPALRGRAVGDRPLPAPAGALRLRDA